VKEFIARVRMIADYQFGEGAGEALVPDDARITISKRTGKPRYIFGGEGNLLATIRWNDGFIALSPRGAKRLLERIPPPRLRVIVSREAAEYVKKGRSVFAKHVIDVDPDIRCGDEVIVVDPDDNIVAVGRAALSAIEMLEFNCGVAVKIRRGVHEE